MEQAGVADVDLGRFREPFLDVGVIRLKLADDESVVENIQVVAYGRRLIPRDCLRSDWRSRVARGYGPPWSRTSCSCVAGTLTPRLVMSISR